MERPEEPTAAIDVTQFNLLAIDLQIILSCEQILSQYHNHDQVLQFPIPTHISNICYDS